MARVQYGSFITDLRGSIGGSTFQNNISGAISRNKPNGRKSTTNYQKNSISVFSYFTRLWATLSLADKILWNDFAALHQITGYWGQLKTITGFNWYVSINTYAFYESIAFFDQPPAFSTESIPPPFTLEITATDFNVLWDPAFDTGTNDLLIFASLPQKQIAINNRKSPRFIELTAPGVISSIDLISLWENYFKLSWPPSSIPGSFVITVNIAQLNPANCISSAFYSVTQTIT